MCWDFCEEVVGTALMDNSHWLIIYPDRGHSWVAFAFVNHTIASGFDTQRCDPFNISFAVVAVATRMGPSRRIHRIEKPGIIDTVTVESSRGAWPTQESFVL